MKSPSVKVTFPPGSLAFPCQTKSFGFLSISLRLHSGISEHNVWCKRRVWSRGWAISKHWLFTGNWALVPSFNVPVPCENTEVTGLV